MAKRYSGAILGIGISGLLIFFLFHNLEWSLLAKELGRYDFRYLPLIIVAVALQLLIRGYRWRYLLPNGSKLSLVKLTEATALGFFANCVLPLRAGEFVRPLMLSRWQPVSFAAGFASVVTERVFDVLALLFLLAICLQQIPNPPELITLGAKFLGGIALCIAAVMVLSYLKADLLLKILETIVGRIFSKHPGIKDKLLSIASEFIAGLKAISSFGELLLTIIWSVVLWLSIAGFYHLVLWSFGIYPPFSVSIMVNVMIAFAVAAPSAPGFLGTFQLGCVASLTGLYGYSRELSIAYSVVAHALTVLLLVVAGVIVLKIEGLGFGDLRKQSKPESVK